MEFIVTTVQNLLISIASTTVMSPALAFPTLAAAELSAYADKDGFIDVQKLTCAQLASTYQEDADMLAAWHSGWYDGLAKRHFAYFTRAKSGEHEIIVYRKANPDKKIIQALDILLKSAKAKK